MVEAANIAGSRNEAHPSSLVHNLLSVADDIEQRFSFQTSCRRRCETLVHFEDETSESTSNSLGFVGDVDDGTHMCVIQQEEPSSTIVLPQTARNRMQNAWNFVLPQSRTVLQFTRKL